MNKKLLLLSAFLAGASWTVLAQDLVLSEGQYYTDETQCCGSIENSSPTFVD